ncbi:MAG TPA: hypothetical protein VGI93_04095 [Steroidobacteraceae bacterium]|jgi:hypothetical protein
MNARQVLVLAGVLTCAAGLPLARADTASNSKGTDLCALASKAEVSVALHVAVVRAEAPDTELPGCDFSIKGTPAAASSGHALDAAKNAAQSNGVQLDQATQNLISSFANGIFQGSDSDKSATAGARHPGEVSILTFVIVPGDGNDQMRLTGQAHAGIAPTAVKPIAKLGDEAFETGGAMLNVRKGNRMIQFTYPSCACTTQDVVPLARKIVDRL